MNLQHIPNMTTTNVVSAIEHAIRQYRLSSQHKFFTDGEYLIGEYMWALYYMSDIAVKHTLKKMYTYLTSTGKTLVEDGAAVEDIIADFKLMVNLMRGKPTSNN